MSSGTKRKPRVGMYLQAVQQSPFWNDLPLRQRKRFAAHYRKKDELHRVWMRAAAALDKKVLALEKKHVTPAREAFLKHCKKDPF